MTVGHELARLTGFKLFHNHMTVEPVLDLFQFGSPPFTRLVDEFRRRILEEAVSADLPGLVFTFVWALDDPGDRALVEEYVEIVEARGGTTYVVELAAPLDVRLVRNATRVPARPQALQAGPRGVERLAGHAEAHMMNTGGDHELAALVGDRPHLRIDNTDLAPDEVAEKIVAAFGLPRPAAS